MNFDTLKLIATVSAKDILDSGLFKLAGSRYMAQKFPEIIVLKKYTDWDFYCGVNDTEALNFIAAAGLHKVKPGKETVYPFDALADSIFLGIDFQIIVRTDPEKYGRVIESLDPEFYRDYLWKSGPNCPQRKQIQDIFNQLFRLVG